MESLPPPIPFDPQGLVALNFLYSQLGVVGRWWSSQQQCVFSGMDGLLLLVVMGEGRLVVPVDCAMRRSDLTGPGVPCRDTLRWAQRMLDERLGAFRRYGVVLPAPLVVADSGCRDAKRMQHVHDRHHGTVLVEGHQSSTFPLPNGHTVKGHDFIHGKGWRWRQHPW